MSHNKIILLTNSESSIQIKNKLEEQKEFEVFSIFHTVSSFINSIEQDGAIYVKEAKAILLLDFAFESPNETTRMKEFLRIQDILNTHNVKQQKLYLLTKDRNLYALIRDGGLPGLDPIIYTQAQVFGIEKTIKYRLILSILRGEQDGKGLHHPDYNKATRNQRLEESAEALISNAKLIPTEVANFGKTEPITTLSKKELLDTPEFSENIKKIEAEEKRLEREKQKELQRLRDKERMANKKPTKDEEFKKGQTVIVKTANVPDASKFVGTVDGTPTNLIKEDELEDRSKFNLESMRKKFQQLETDDTEVTQKLKTDKGVIFVSGGTKSGVSGFVSNSADMYALSNRKVLVIDLDLMNRSQALYYSSYDEKVDAYMGRSKGLLDTVKGSALSSSVVQITSRIHVLGVSRKENLLEDNIDDISEHLSTLLLEARDLYDIVIVDCPMRYLGYYINDVLNANAIIFVQNNKWYDIDTFINRELLNMKVALSEDEFVRLLRKTHIVLNMFKKGLIDLNGVPTTMANIKNQFIDKGNPYDMVSVVGEIPTYNEWETQYIDNIRYIFKDSMALGLFNYIWSKVEL